MHRLYLRAGFANTALKRTGAKVAAAIAVAWLPLLMASLVEAWAAPEVLGRFATDVELHVRFLLAVPLLIAGARFADIRLNEALRQFDERQLIAQEDDERFDAMIAATERLRDSVWPETILLLLVVTVGHYLFRAQVAEKAIQWYGEPAGAGRPFAGMWYGSVSMALFQFLLFRWYFRLILWFALLWRIAGLRLHIVPTHPDRAGGTEFIGQSLFAFTPFILAHSSLLSGLLANRILDGAMLLAFRVQVAGVVGILLALLLLPLLRFTPSLRLCRRRGLLEYGEVAMRCVREFDLKWRRDGAARGAESLVESGDVQSVADMASSFEIVRGMRVTPFGQRTVLGLVALLLLPLLPLTLTMFSVQQLLSALLKVIF